MRLKECGLSIQAEKLFLLGENLCHVQNACHCGPPDFRISFPATSQQTTASRATSEEEQTTRFARTKPSHELHRCPVAVSYSERFGSYSEIPSSSTTTTVARRPTSADPVSSPRRTGLLPSAPQWQNVIWIRDLIGFRLSWMRSSIHRRVSYRKVCSVFG